MKKEFLLFIVFNLLKPDLPIQLKEKVRAQLLPHYLVINLHDVQVQAEHVKQEQ